VLAFHDHRQDPSAWARGLGISREAVEIYLGSDVIDLHVDSFIWTRTFGYRLDRRHGRGLLGGHVYSQVDLPRIREAAITGAVWAITTNPLRREARRPGVLADNLAHLLSILEGCRDDVVVCRTAADYRRARSQDKHAAFIGIQGGNALAEPAELDRDLLAQLLRVTLVHFSTSPLGVSSAARGKPPGDGRLTARGAELVHRLDEARVFVDLAHIHRRGFFDAVAAHDRTLPLVVSHTGVSAVTPHWRNVDDEQLRAIAATGGVVGVMFQSSFLGDRALAGRAESIVAHLEHIVATIGEDHAAIGSDWDGAILPPRDLPTCLELPRLVELMLARGWSADRIHKILGGNALRALAALRP
jgi:membrane dipeptidase